MTETPPLPDADQIALLRAGRWREALAGYRRRCREHPGDLEARFRLGLTEAAAGRYDEAGATFGSIVASERDEGLAEAHFNLGRVLALLGRLDEAREHYRLAVERRPGFAEALSTWASLLRKGGRLDEARAAYERAMEATPNLGDPRIHLIPETDPAAIEAAIGRFRCDMHSNLLFLLAYHCVGTPAELLAASRDWERRHGHGERAPRRAHARSTDGRLRIGYVSPDFRRHPVSDFFLPIVEAHDREAVEVFCYAEVHRPDVVSERIRTRADHWTQTTGMDDRALADRIREDGIDVLVDLAGHTAGNRLRTFTLRPAPIQATYLGYFATTGLAAMDYWISDPVLTPEDTIELATETIFRLPRCCLAYAPPTDAPDVRPRPDAAPLTFGSFNDLSKVSGEAIALWSAVLERCPEARMAIKARQLTDPAERQRLVEAFARHGIAASRILLSGPTPGIAEHLALYGEIDIALDTVPRTGGATTAEALWMGVPVVTLAGRRFIERLSATMLDACGLGDLVTTDSDAYVERAVSLAQDVDERRRLRRTLRPRLASSPLADARGLARSLESAYRSMVSRRKDRERR